MNRTGKRCKVNKCPPTQISQENKVTEIETNCNLNENISEKVELINGLVNGISNDKSLSRKKKGGKNLHLSSQSGDCDDHCENDISCRIQKFSGISEEQLEYNDISEHQSNSVNDTSVDSKSDTYVNNLSKSTRKSRKKKTSVDISPNKFDVSSSHDICSKTRNLTNECCSSEKQIDIDEIKPNILKNDEALQKLIYKQTVTSSTQNLKVLNACKSNEELLKISENMSNVVLRESDEVSNSLIKFIQYESELQMPMIMKIIQKDLSEPYSIYTYRYFIHNWPKLCFLAMSDGDCVGAIVCKLDIHRKVIKRGYIAMLAVDQNYRKQRIGSNLVQMAIEEMIVGGADEVVLETEVTNKPALQLYEKLGFVRDKRLFRYYLNGVDALRLKLWLR